MIFCAFPRRSPPPRILCKLLHESGGGRGAVGPKLGQSPAMNMRHPFVSSFSAVLLNQQYCQHYCWLSSNMVSNVSEYSAILPLILATILLNQQYFQQNCQQYCWFKNIVGNIGGNIAEHQYCSHIAGNIADSAILLAYFPATLPIWPSGTLLAYFFFWLFSAILLNQQYCQQ